MQNLHTHTIYCDGVDTPEEMVTEAINKGFSSIGFSGHSYMGFAEEYSMTLEGTEKYKNEIDRLKEKYKDKIKIFCGLEYDMYSGSDKSGYDYLIGAVHYLKLENEIVGFDRNATEVKTVIDKYFNGKGIEYAKAYYEELVKLPQYGNFDIIAHFDVITKHSENVSFFDETEEEYKNAAIEAARVLAGKIPFFEVNTGAIARGYRTTPYPAPFLLEEFNRLGFGAVISSDCHNKKMLDCKFEEAKLLLKKYGFKEHYILTENGFESVLL